MDQRRARRLIWMAIGLQFLGYVFDAAWHGLIAPGAEPTTVHDMLRHLVTVHLPLYVGALAVLVSTGAAAFSSAARSTGGLALRVAFGGAALSAGAEAWHALSHLQLDTHTAPVAGILSVVGFAIVVLATALSGRRRHVPAVTRSRRAA